MLAQTEVRTVAEGTFKYVAKLFDEAATDRSLMLTQVEQVIPSPAMVEEFEAGRTRMEAALRSRGERLTTRQLWAAPPDEHYESVLQHGFFGTFRGSPVAFFADPARALVAAVAPRRLLLCRVALGVQGSDYSETTGAWLVHSHTAVPAFSCTWRRKTVASAAVPTAVVEQQLLLSSPPTHSHPPPKKCSACGQAASEPDARFCISCGARF